MNTKNYRAHVIPYVADATEDDQGKAVKGKATYLKHSLTTEKRTAAGIKSQGYYQIALYEEASNPFQGDPKPYTMNIFRNANPAWFDHIESCIGDKTMHEVLKTESQVAVLNDLIPGLVVEVPTGFNFYATVMNKKTGVEERLLSNQRNRQTGNYDMTPVILNKVKFFMFKSQVSENDEEYLTTKAMLAAPEIGRANDFRETPGNVSTPKTEADAVIIPEEPVKATG